MSHPQTASPFLGWRIVGGAFILAAFGWGLGFYGPPIYLHAVREARGWPVSLISAAVTVHYLVGAIVVANLPKLYRRFGLVRVTRAGSVALAIGVVGWAVALEPWQLFIATLLSGAGWVTMGAAAINAIIAPWFVSQRPRALSMAYNGASVGGIVFAPLWVAGIAGFGFALSAAVIGFLAIVVAWFLTHALFSKTPENMGQVADGGVVVAGAKPAAAIAPLPEGDLWKSWRFRTLSAGMALGLFAQIGLLAHLFSLVVPALGAGIAGWAMALATASAIAGRTAFGWLMPAHADRRLTAALSYTIQIAGCVLLAASGAVNVPLILIGIVLFGFGIGNATSLPPLIAQAEFSKQDSARVVPMIVAIGQASYAFAPAMFGILRELPHLAPAPHSGAAVAVFIGTALVMLAAIAAFLAGRNLAGRNTD